MDIKQFKIKEIVYKLIQSIKNKANLIEILPTSSNFQKKYMHTSQAIINNF